MIGRTFHGDRLRAIRQQAGIRQRRFAQEVGCHISTVVRAETANNQYISFEMAYQFVATLNRLGATADGRPVTLDDLSTPNSNGCPECAARAAAVSA